ncbi:MAG: hypothetical protein V2A58_16705 [Planctomycetota bacterium]
MSGPKGLRETVAAMATEDERLRASHALGLIRCPGCGDLTAHAWPTTPQRIRCCRCEYDEYWKEGPK